MYMCVFVSICASHTFSSVSSGPSFALSHSNLLVLFYLIFYYFLAACLFSTVRRIDPNGKTVRRN